MYVFHLYFALSPSSLNKTIIVSKVTLDIICETAFGYQTDSLHNPHNELAEAYEKLTSMQTGLLNLFINSYSPIHPSIIFTGPNVATLIAVLSIPGSVRLLSSDWVYRNRRIFTYFKDLGTVTTRNTILSRSLVTFDH